jgi:membrane associated rhomboid family serine protease
MSNFQFRSYDRFPPIVKNLIIINVLVFVAQMVFDDKYLLTAKIALWPVATPYFEPYQVFTHMFAHSTNFIFHIIFNMLVLYSFGRVLENLWGPKRFLFFYLASGVGAAAAHLIMQHLMNPNLPVPAVGASGAIMGVFVAFAYLFPNTELMIMPIPIPIKAKWLALAYIGFDLLGGFGKFAGSNIAHFAHLGGALTGFLIVLYWNKNNRRTLY